MSASRTAQSTAAKPFLRIPPFPGRKIRSFELAPQDAPDRSDFQDIAERLRQFRVGGAFWASQPQLPARYVLVRSDTAVEAAQSLDSVDALVLWTKIARPVPGKARIAVTGESDPWYMLAGANALVTEAEDEVTLVAALLGVPIYQHVRGELHRLSKNIEVELGTVLPHHGFADPFSGDSISLESAIDLCGFWRNLIDRNRDIVGGLGFAFWKQENIASLLWDGSNPFRFFKTISDIPPTGSVAIWLSKTSESVLRSLEARRTALVEIEDGFLRSHGLGADCVPPLSITADGQGAYFDPAKPSELENLLQSGQFGDELIGRAKRLRHTIVQAGLSKYECGNAEVARRSNGRRHILVPGQVEDDRSVQTGGCGLSTNLELLRRVREQARDAYILYKPHPDVVAGHRKGALSDRKCLQYADEIFSDDPITSLIAMADEVHVNTSLAGFEALMREKPVTTYGVPFYAGWGLTQDLGPVPARRTAKRTLDELVAATLLLYPRYLDPTTGLPCPPEVVVERLSGDAAPDKSLVVTARRLQGKLVRSVRSLVQ